MAIEWDTRINRPITLAAASSATTRYFNGLLRLPGERFTVEVRTRVPDSRFGEPVPPEALATSRDPFDDPGGRPAKVLFAVPELDAAAVVRVDELFPRDEDEVSRLHAYVSSWRTNASQVLSIATVIAFADQGDGTVVDEGALLDAPIRSAPGELFERMRAPRPEPDVATAIDEVLRKTRLRRDY